MTPPFSLGKLPARFLASALATAMFALVATSASASTARAPAAADDAQSIIAAKATDKRADTVYNAWINTFLVHDGSNIYFGHSLNDHSQAEGWVDATDTMQTSDVYERTHSRTQQQFVNDLVKSVLAVNGTDWWQGYEWDDDIAWISMAQLRAYQTTGEQVFLDNSVKAWNIVYNQGWDTTSGGGGIWEKLKEESKCGLSNNPMVTVGAALAQITGDVTYLSKAETIYAWLRTNLYNTTTGQFYGCMKYPGRGPTGAVQDMNSDNVWDSGAFLEGAISLYRVTGNTQYRDDTQLAVKHVIDHNPIVSHGAEKGGQWSYYFFRGLNQYCTLTKSCSQYLPWIRANAKAAWANRDANGLTWDDWTHPTNFTDPDAQMMSSAVAIWQLIPRPTPAKAFPGTYQLQNGASKMVLSIAGDVSDNGAAVVQEPVGTSKTATWKLVPSDNGYYQVKNVKTGLMLNVAGASGARGAAVVQWPDQGPSYGNDQWLPVKQTDGSYVLFNLNSHFALDNPGGSGTAGTPVSQWSASGTTAQEFTLVPVKTE